ncbi:MAG: hypothetical protein Q8J78_00910 [Moraxellaceae bacterium]|nr:hypothetical protein [Moraxellaceae bacterium]
MLNKACSAEDVRHFLFGKIAAAMPANASLPAIATEVLLADLMVGSLKAMVIISSLKEISPLDYSRIPPDPAPIRTVGDLLDSAYLLCGLRPL